MSAPWPPKEIPGVFLIEFGSNLGDGVGDRDGVGDGVKGELGQVADPQMLELISGPPFMSTMGTQNYQKPDFS